MDIKGKNVFVTGGFGFVGSNLVKRLKDKGANVILLKRDDTFFSKEYTLFNQCNIVTGDINDLNLMKRIMTEYEIDIIFHLAAQAIVDIAVKNPVETLTTNIIGTVNILEAARCQNVKAVVIASSDKAYGEGIIPYTEDQPLRGTAPYDVSKSCADLIANAYYKTYLIPVVTVRCANIYGPNDFNFNRLIPGAIRSALKQEEFIIRSDGNFIRDFLFVEDAVSAYISCVENILIAKGKAFNFGTGKKDKVIDVVKMIFELCDSEENKIVIKNTAEHEIKDQYMDSFFAKQVLGWKPEYTLEDGLKETIGWYKKWI